MKKVFTQILLTLIIVVSMTSIINAQTYCIPSYSSTCCMGFDNVQFGSVNNNSNYGNGYEDYTSTITTEPLIKGTSFNLSFHIPQYTYDLYVYAWIDFNCDGDFTDAGEEVLSGNYCYYGNTYSYSIYVPGTATTGSSRIRLSGQYGYMTPTNNPCGSFWYGDVEDYAVSFITPSPMTIDSTNTVSLDTNSVFIGLNYAKMIGVNIYTGGNLSPKQVQKVYFSTNPSTNASDIGRVSLYKNNNFPWQESDTLSTPIVSPNGAFYFNVYKTLSPGTTKYYIGYDISPDAVENNYVDARCDSILISGVMYYPKVKSPVGARKVVTQKNFNGYCTINRVYSANYAVGTIRVKFAGIDNITGTPAGNPAYTFYTAMIPTVFIQKTYPLSVSQGTFQSNNSAAVYIDWNNNGYFDANELVVSFMNQPASTTNTYDLTIPCGTSPGIHRMRISSDMYNTPQGCGQTYYGEYEDYLFNVPKQVTPVVDFATNDTNYVGGFTNFKPSTTIDGDLVYLWDIDNNGTIEDSTLSGDNDYSYKFTTAGSIPVALTGKLYGCTSILTSAKYIKNVLVVAPSAPKVNFIATLNSVTPQIPTTFTDLTTQGPNKWKWKITPSEIDGQATFTITPSDTSQNVTVKFTKVGQYSVTLVATNAVKTDSASKVNYISVSSPQLMCSSGSAVSNDKSGYLYDDGGKYGNYAEATTWPSSYCSYLIQPKCAAGVTLTLTEMDINSYNSTGCIQINHADYIAIYDGTNKSGKALHLSLVDMYNNPIYPFGIQNGPSNVMRTPPYPTLTGTSGSLFIEFGKNCNGVGAGFEAIWTTQLLTPSVAPVASFSVPDTAYLYQTIAFDGSQSTGYELEYAWDMNGDGLTDAVNPVSYYTFTQPGKYIVSLSANSCALSDKKYDTILVLVPTFKPVANFAAEFTKISSSDILNIFDKSSKSVYKWKWTVTPSTFVYKNGTSATTKDLAIQFTAPGIYSVKLVVTNSKGADSITKLSYIQVYTICEPNVLAFNPDLGISQFTMTDANGNVLINQTSTIGETAYSNYANTQKALVYNKGKYKITLNRNTNFNKITRTVWIDYNQDGIFSSSEIVLLDTNSPNIEVSKNIIIPATALQGKARMRIGANAGVLSNKPCGPNNTGEFEDYSLDIQLDKVKPVITLIGADTIPINSCASFTDPGYTAKDNADGDITKKVTRSGNINNIVQGFYPLTYSVTDTNGNIGTKTRWVQVLRDLIPPVITIKGSENIKLTVKTPYVSKGVTVSDNCTGINKLDSTGTVNTNALGVYIIKYIASDKAVPANYDTAIKTITVVDDSIPKISLIGTDTMFVEVYTPFTDPGVLVTDNFYTGLTATYEDNINTDQIGTYFRTYCVTDPSGNGPVCIDRVIIVEDNTPPTIALKGDDTIVINVNDNYSEPGCIYSDNYWTSGNLILVVSGTVNSYILGSYQLSYKVFDGSGNISAILYRTVKVVDNVEPEIALVGPTTVVLNQWEAYKDEGVEVLDNYYKPAALTIKYNEHGTFQNTLWPGLYSYSYSVCDPSGNCSKEISRNIYVIKSTSSIGDGSVNDYIKYYPNPANSELNIDINLPATYDVAISIFNSLGEKVMDVHKGNIRANIINVNTMKLSPGIYYLRVDLNNNEQINKKFIIAR